MVDLFQLVPCRCPAWQETQRDAGLLQIDQKCNVCIPFACLFDPSGRIFFSLTLRNQIKEQHMWNALVGSSLRILPIHQEHHSPLQVQCFAETHFPNVAPPWVNQKPLSKQTLQIWPHLVFKLSHNKKCFQCFANFRRSSEFLHLPQPRVSRRSNL